MLVTYTTLPPVEEVYEWMGPWVRVLWTLVGHQSARTPLPPSPSGLKNNCTQAQTTVSRPRIPPPPRCALPHCHMYLTVDLMGLPVDETAPDPKPHRV